jgi:hypothetical protein
VLALVFVAEIQMDDCKRLDEDGGRGDHDELEVYATAVVE